MTVNWEGLSAAFDLVSSGAVRKVEGDGWLVYAVGNNLIRVDIKVQA